MHNNWEEMLPFYIAGTLPKNDTRRLEKHLSNCEECRKSLAEWQRIAEATRAEAASQMRNLPPLSPQILSLASQQAGARASQPLVYDFARGTGYRSRYRSTTVTLVAAAFTVFLIGGLLTLLVLSGSLVQQITLWLLFAAFGFTVDFLDDFTYVITPTIIYNFVLIWPTYWLLRKIQRRVQNVRRSITLD